MNAKGKDGSYWNGPNFQYPNVDWVEAIESCNLSFGFFRACLAHYTDPTFNFHWEATKDKILRGGYCLLLPGYPILPQVQKLVELTGGAGEMPDALDIETAGLTPGMATAAKDEYYNLTGRKAIIYTRGEWWDTNMGIIGWEKAHDLWVANYGVKTPVIPKAWSEWTFWQDSKTENCPGFDDPTTDRDWFNGTEEELIAYFNGTMPPPPVGIDPLYLAKVNAYVLNVRSEPNAQSDDLGNLIKETIIPVIEEDGNWARIDGWIHKNYIQKL